MINHDGLRVAAKAACFVSVPERARTSFFGNAAKGVMMVARGTWHCLVRSAVQGRE